MNAVFAESKLGLMNDNISNINYLRIFVGITGMGCTVHVTHISLITGKLLNDAKKKIVAKNWTEQYYTQLQRKVNID